MLILTVASVIAVLQSVQGGYNYWKPDVSFDLPNNPTVAGRIQNGYTNADEKKSYSLSYKDYNYLQQQKHRDITQHVHNVQSSPINLRSEFVPVLNEARHNVHASISNRLFINSHNAYNPLLGQGILTHQELDAIKIQNNESPVINVPNVQNSRLAPNLINANSNMASKLNVQNAYALNNLPFNVDNHIPTPFNVQNDRQPYNLRQNSPSLLQNIATLPNVSPNLPQYSSQMSNAATQNIYSPPNVLDENTLPNIQNIPPQIIQNVSPVITKNIYFHIPPPEIEETPVTVAPEPPKKTYKIILIKLPSQFRNIADLQAKYYRRGSSDDKTLIYVLVNKDQSFKMMVPNYKPSEHEVLFVKYKGKDNIS